MTEAATPQDGGSITITEGFMRTTDCLAAVLAAAAVANVVAARTAAKQSVVRMKPSVMVIDPPSWGVAASVIKRPRRPACGRNGAATENCLWVVQYDGSSSTLRA